MARLPFNFSALPDQDPGPPALRERDESKGSPGPLTVTQAAALIKGVLAERAPSPIRIVGEVSNFTDRNHWYFSLKDEGASLPCVMWAATARKSLFTPEHGQQVVVSGRLDFYGPQGKLQVYVESMEPVGRGPLEVRYRQLCEELRKAGYFDEARKRAMPVFARHIAVVTSATGAALQDVIRTARQRWAGVKLSHFDVRVQGPGAAEEIARAVGLLSEQHERLGIEVIVLTRGGGSLEDLWAFNERVVADAVFRSRVPVAVGVGHETDTTIAELVADLRCSTPTQVAARIVPDAAAESQHLEQMEHRLTHGLLRLGEHARTRLDALARHPIFRRPTDRFRELRREVERVELGLSASIKGRVVALSALLDSHRHSMACIEPVTRLRAARQQVAEGERRLVSSLAHRMQARGERLAALERQLEAVGPTSVLNRGYTYTTDPSGRLLKTAAAAREAGSLVTRFVDGEVGSRVTGGVPLAVLPGPKRRKAAVDRDEVGLFSADDSGVPK